MNCQLKFLWSVAIVIGSLGIGCKKENTYPANQMHQVPSNTTNPISTSGSGKVPSSPINIPKKGIPKISQAERMSYLRNPLALRGVVLAGRRTLARKSAELAESSKKIDAMRKELSRTEAEYESLASQESHRSSHRLNALEASIEKQISELRAARNVHKTAKDEFELEKEEHNEYEGLLTESER